MNQSQHPCVRNWKSGLSSIPAVVAIVAAGCMLYVKLTPASVSAQAPTGFNGPTSSQPLALPANNQFLAVVNPDNNSVSFFDLRADRNNKIAEVEVQKEPNSVAITPDGRKAYVANTVSGTVSVINLNLANGVAQQPHNHIDVGVEPHSLVLTPSGRRLYVANSRSNSISVIDTTTDYVIRTIRNVGPEPRGLAITNDGDADDWDETLFVTLFYSLPVPGKLDGSDDAKVGHVTVISLENDTVIADGILNPLADSGFKAQGDALARIPIGTEFNFNTGAYPNLLNNVAIKGQWAFFPNTGASPNGPLRFDVNTQSLLNVMRTDTYQDIGRTINMHRAVADQTGQPKLFVTQPWAMAFEHNSWDGWVLSAASNVAFKVVVDPTNGQPAVQRFANDDTRVLQIPTGRNPRGIVINNADTRAYVMNYIGRDVTVIDLANERVLTTMQSAELPTFGSEEDKIHAGKELYNTSVGVFDGQTPFAPPIRGRMSNNGWGACSACHPNGLTDNVVWIFNAGPRRTISQHADFDQTDPNRARMRPLNWSANRDEQEDFENNIRGVSGGLGLLVQSDGVSQEPTANVNDFTPLANGGRLQLKIRGVPAWDAIKAYIQFGIRAPLSAVSQYDYDAADGRSLFIAANCQSCHGGPQWSTARVDFTPPPAAAAIVAGQIIAQLKPVGTFDPTVFNEIRQNAVAPLGAAGFVPPSLLSLSAFPQTFLHNGAAASLSEVMNNVTHRSAGTAGVDTLSNAADREKLVRFLESIDANTTPVNP